MCILFGIKSTNNINDLGTLAFDGRQTRRPNLFDVTDRRILL